MHWSTESVSQAAHISDPLPPHVIGCIHLLKVHISVSQHSSAFYWPTVWNMHTGFYQVARR